MASSSQSYRYVVRVAGVRGGNPIVEGTRIAVHDVIGLPDKCLRHRIPPRRNLQFVRYQKYPEILVSKSSLRYALSLCKEVRTLFG